MRNKKWNKIHHKHQASQQKTECMKSFFSKFNTLLLRINPSLLLLSLGFSFCLSVPVQAADFRSISPVKAIGYDAPSVEASKIYIMAQGYPVEVIVNLGAWVKVRDQLGALTWAEAKDLDVKRTVLVISDAEIREAESPDAKLLAMVEKQVVLELLSSEMNNSWVKVKHRDGIVGYIQRTAIWGL
jgi:SH3-like domain-containing protein